MTMVAVSRPFTRPLIALLLAIAAAVPAQAQLFSDDEARRAILDLRQRFDQAVLAQNRLVDENTQLRRSVIDLQQQIESLRGELARSRGQQEQLARDVAQLQQRQAADLQAMDERLRKLEAALATLSESAANAAATAKAAEEAEKRDFNAALAVFRAGDFVAAQGGFANFIKRYPRSADAPAALFWLGNAQYATRNYREAITNFRSLLDVAPSHDKAPEAMLSIANCQIELKETQGARTTLNTLVRTYPQSEAAQAGRERLAKLK